jgi:hypothetical protein
MDDLFPGGVLEPILLSESVGVREGSVAKGFAI